MNDISTQLNLLLVRAAMEKAAIRDFETGLGVPAVTGGSFSTDARPLTQAEMAQLETHSFMPATATRFTSRPPQPAARPSAFVQRLLGSVRKRPVRSAVGGGLLAGGLGLGALFGGRATQAEPEAEPTPSPPPAGTPGQPSSGGRQEFRRNVLKTIGSRIGNWWGHMHRLYGG